MSDLLPCPFCGGEAEILKEPLHLDGVNNIIIMCKSCKVGMLMFKVEEEAIEAWNTRPDNWISVDILPEYDGSYLITSTREDNGVGLAYWDGREFWLGTAPVFKETTHWMLLPEPPKK